MLEYTKARGEAVRGLKKLEMRMEGPEGMDPDSVQILRSKNEKEKEYLLRTIINMELKQLAESITMIAYKKKLNKMSQSKFRNRPLLWAERIDQVNKGFNQSKRLAKTGRIINTPSTDLQLLQAQFSLDQKWVVENNQLYCL